MTDTLVLIHGFPLDGSMWDFQDGALLGTLQVLAPSLPGFGGTPAAGSTMTMHAAAGAVFAAMDAAGARQAVIGGISMGGYVALEMWRQAPQRFQGLILANTRSGADDDAGRQRRLDLAARLEAEGSAFLVENPGPLLSETAGAELWGDVRAIVGAQPAVSIAAAARGMAERPDSTGDLASISVPTMVITSTGDTLIPAEVTSPMADLITGATLETIDGAGHLSNMEAPGEFTMLVERHLTICGLL
jgi:pimeloyl-ACP methyl ester carboxylesterase